MTACVLEERMGTHRGKMLIQTDCGAGLVGAVLYVPQHSGITGQGGLAMTAGLNIRSPDCLANHGNEAGLQSGQELHHGCHTAVAGARAVPSTRAMV